MVEIATLRIMAGRHRPKDVAEAMAWAGENLDVLRRRWEELNERS